MRIRSRLPGSGLGARSVQEVSVPGGVSVMCRPPRSARAALPDAVSVVTFLPR